MMGNARKAHALPSPLWEKVVRAEAMAEREPDEG
jgi:hypothetical protein